MKFLTLAFANQKNILLTILENSLIKYGYKYRIIGHGLKWENFMTKIRTCYDYIKTVPDNSIICIIDAYDVLACDTPQNLLNKFLSFNKNIVVGAENACGGNCVELTNYLKYNNEDKLNYQYANG